ncbi:MULTISPECIES: ATPase domain-containing protein [Sphingobium]|uniref:ATPase domain-containing protein n=1 Tax=Sphingobium TaxID=165695 RepID=UPI0017F6156D|nr:MULTISPECIES: ATPase domain-containing protein [Sphingobium]MCW2363919.1 circadian clock protein KaiC [Sphingobium sp. B10D3B]MCW2402684.1 circadian clock protein KaiC [Sphingobium sp. B10D7B]MCW2409663.1 circadian clock protein KaiC [Sphingobium xanthum]
MDRTAKASSGIEGLDDVTAGGFACGRLFLVEGDPGTGKTTIASQFLMNGAEAGERGLYITLSETEEELRETAASHCWALNEHFHIFELVPPETLLDENQQQSLLYSSDLELGETTKRILEAIERVKPQRMVIDSLSEIRLLAQSSLRYRRQILALKHYFAKHNATVLMLDDLTSDTNDKTVHSVAHGVLRLEELAPLYGSERRRLRMLKYRGQRYRGGYHDFVINTGGVRVFPRLVSLEHKSDFVRATAPTESAELNALLGGGFDSGTSTLILGPTGTGKSLLALNLIKGCIARGETAAMFVFDEELGLLADRAKGLGIDVSRLVADGKLIIEQVDAAEMSPGEFAHRVRATVEEHGIRTVVIDSLNGYRAAMPEESALVLHIHELLQYLNRRGASTFLTVTQHGVVGDMQAPVDITYLADTVVLLRYFEAVGHVRRAISIVKKRSGVHENTIREYRIDAQGITIGEPLTHFQGVLRGIPTMVGAGNLMDLGQDKRG